MDRWALVQNGAVREYLLAATEWDEATLIAAQRRRTFGDEDDGSAPMDAQGEWVRVADPAMLVTTGWRYVNEQFLPPAA